MSKKSKIITDFAAESNANYSDTVTISCKSLDANSGSFTGLPNVTADVMELLGKFNGIRLQPVYDSQTIDTNNARLKVDIVFTANCTWINTFAKGDLSVLKKSGVPLQKEDEAQPQLPATIIVVNNTKVDGQLEYHISHLPFQGIKYGVMYTLETNEDNNAANWKFFYCGGIRHGIIEGLTSKANYKMVAFGMGTDKTITYSEPIICSPK